MKQSLFHYFCIACYVTLLLLTVTASGLIIYIGQFDLSDYQQDLEQELSTILEQPVTIGSSALTWQKGIALELNDLQIGQPDSPLVDIPHLSATLKIKPLLDGRLVLDQVAVDKPKLQFWLPTIARSDRGTTHELMDKLGIQILTIKDAELTIHQRLEGSSSQLLHLNKIYLVLTDWEAGKSGRLVIDGQYPQQQQAAEFTLDLNLPTSTHPADWREENLRYRLRVKNLSTARLTNPASKNIPATIDLIAKLDGSPATGAILQAEVFSHTNREPLLKASGNWQSTRQQESLSQLTGTLLGLPLDGEFSLQRLDQIHLLSGKIASLPTALTPELLTRWRIPQADKLRSGWLERFTLQLKQQWDADKKPVGLPKIDTAFTITTLAWDSPELQQLQDLTIDLSLRDQQLTINEGTIVTAGHPIWFDGQIDNLFKQPQLDLKLLYEPQLAALKRQHHWPQRWQLEGTSSIALKLSGPLQELNYRLDIDLTDAGLSLANLLQKPAGQPASLEASGLIDREQLEIAHFQLKLGESRLSGAGLLPLKNAGETILFNLDEFDLAQLQQHSPLLKKLQLIGKASLFLDRSDDEFQANLTLSDAGAHLFHIVGDLNRTSGEIVFTRQGFSFHDIEAALGDSPLRVSGVVDSWADPQLRLEIRGEKVRARDLIFRNEELTLYDLDGKLRITASDLFFEPVKVRLEEETWATVSGKVDNFKDPQVTLDIRSDQANILDVIKLFTGPKRNPQKKPRREFKPLSIKVKAENGTLGGLRFNTAEGTITDHRGVLTIYPLSFKTVSGYCFVRVEVDRNQPQGLLKVSGHAEDLDASVLHEDIFLKRGLVSGRLRGNFYLEGKPGLDFWPTASGGIHLQIKKGALRKFRGLAQAFSILNVSQLFSFRLPDMKREGMPFDLLEGSIRVTDGLMTTNDMHILSEAMNMSMTGTKNLINDTVDFDVGVMPLRTVDKVITNIPIAGWILAGEEKALISAQFKIKGPSADPDVSAVPISSVSDTVFGILKRTIGLPIKLIKDFDNLTRETPPKKK